MKDEGRRTEDHTLQQPLANHTLQQPLANYLVSAFMVLTHRILTTDSSRLYGRNPAEC